MAESVGNNKSPNLSEKGQPGIASISKFIDDLRRTELKMPQRLCTFDQMCEDAAVANSLDIRQFLCAMGLSEGWFKSTGTEKSDLAAQFLNYNIHNMKSGSWLQAMRDACTDIKYGFSILNIVLEYRQVGKYKGSYVLKKLSPRSAKSVYAWVFDDNFRELKGFVQKPMLTKNRTTNGDYVGNIPYSVLANNSYKSSDYPYFRKNEFMIFSYNSTSNNPQGNPPLASCFNAYLEKKVTEQYELAGLSKDLGGVFVARSPSELFEKANDPSNYPEAARAKAEFEDDLGKLHKSETTFVHLQSDTDERGNYLYDFQIKGVEGGGKQYSSTDIIREKTKAIYNVFGTMSLLLGQDSVGSNALSKDQNTTFRYYVEKDMAEKADAINKQLAVPLLAANGIELEFDDMPVFTPLNPFKLSADEAGKFVQRVASVNKLTPQLYASILDDLGYDYGGFEVLEELDYSDKGQSRSGDGMGTPFEGTRKTAGDGDDNAMNMDNAS